MALDSLLHNDIVFDSKPDAVPYNYRLSYKIAQLCLILLLCCGRQGCSLLKIQMISTSMYTKESKKSLLNFLDGNLSLNTLVRFDPAVNRAVSFAQFYGLIRQQKNGLFRLAESGKKYAALIKQSGELMLDEIDFLSKISINLNEDMINSIASTWRYQDAED